VAEYELHEGTSFELVSANGDSLVPPQEISSLMTYLNPETEVLGKQQEEEALRDDMRRDLANKIMRRLQAQL
jgi:LPS-assembly lipoprotein